MTDEKDSQALQVQENPLPAPCMQITEANVQAFYTNPANAKYIWSITHLFYERIWQLQDAKTITKPLLKSKLSKWFKGNTSIKSAPRNTTDVEAFSRFVVAFAMMTRDWKPPFFQLDDPHKAFDIPTFVDVVATLLMPTRGAVPTGAGYQEWVDLCPTILLLDAHLQPLPADFSVPPPGLILPKPVDALTPQAITEQPSSSQKDPATKTSTPAHSEGIMKSSGKQAKLDEHTDDSDNFSLKAVWQAIENINKAGTGGCRACYSSQIHGKPVCTSR